MPMGGEALRPPLKFATGDDGNIIITLGGCFIPACTAVLRQLSGQMAISDDQYEKRHLCFLPQGVLSQLKVICQFYYLHNNNIIIH